MGYLPLKPYLSLAQYEKIFFVLIILFMLWGYEFFLRSYHLKNSAMWTWCLLLVFHGLLIRGMYHYSLGIGITLCLMGLLHRLYESFSWPRFIGFLMMFYLAWMSHPFNLMMLAVYGAIHFYLHRNKRGLQFILLILVLLALGASFVLPHFLYSQQNQLAMPYQFKGMLILIAEFFAKQWLFYQPWEYWILAPVVSLVLYLFWKFWRYQNWQSYPYAPIFLLLYFIFPSDGYGGGHLNERFVPYLLLFLPLGLPIDWRRWIVMCCCLFLVTSYHLHRGMQQIDKQTQNIKKITEELPKYSNILPINFEDYGVAKNYASYRHLWANYDPDLQLNSPYLFVHHPAMPLTRHIHHPLPAPTESFASEIRFQTICQSRDAVEAVQCSERIHAAYQQLLAYAPHYQYYLVMFPTPEFIQMINQNQKFKLLNYIGAIYLFSVL